MAKKITGKNVQINEREIGENSVIKLSVKTAVWLLGIVFTIVMSILTYSYFNLKTDNENFKTQMTNQNKEFQKELTTSNKSIQTDVTNIRLGVEGIKGDIKLILDRQDRDKPVSTSNNYMQPVAPPDLPLDIDTTGTE